MKHQSFHSATEHDGRPIVEITCLKDLEKLKEYKERGENVRIVIEPHKCTDNYAEIMQNINVIVGNTTSNVYNISLKKEKKN